MAGNPEMGSDPDADPEAPEAFVYVETLEVKRQSDGRPYLSPTRTFREAALSDDDVLELRLASAAVDSDAAEADTQTLVGKGFPRGGDAERPRATISAQGNPSSPTLRIHFPKKIREELGLEADDADTATATEAEEPRFDCYALPGGRMVAFTPARTRTLTLADSPF